jgi:hypothetical protein
MSRWGNDCGDAPRKGRLSNPFAPPSGVEVKRLVQDLRESIAKYDGASARRLLGEALDPGFRPSAKWASEVRRAT